MSAHYDEQPQTDTQTTNQSKGYFVASPASPVPCACFSLPPLSPHTHTHTHTQHVQNRQQTNKSTHRQATHQQAAKSTKTRPKKASRPHTKSAHRKRHRMGKVHHVRNRVSSHIAGGPVLPLAHISTHKHTPPTSSLIGAPTTKKTTNPTSSGSRFVP